MSDTVPTPPPIDPTPKQEFHRYPKAVSLHNELIQSDQFNSSLNVALAEYQRQLVALTDTSGANLNQAAVAHIKICGAMELIKVIKFLGFQVILQPTKQTGQLNHKQ